MDVDRLKMENEAWDKARELAKKYGVVPSNITYGFPHTDQTYDNKNIF